MTQSGSAGAGTLRPPGTGQVWRGQSWRSRGPAGACRDEAPEIHRASVLIADDHQATREELERTFADDARFLVCALAVDAPGAVEAATRERPDLCLLDVSMPGSGIAAAWEIAARLPTSRIVMLTVSSDESDLFEALRLGARGYLLKGLPAERIAQALAHVMRGEVAIPRALVARLADEFRSRAPRRRTLVPMAVGPQLTSREWEVMDLIRRDLTTAEIAKRLFVSHSTVRTHIAAALRKLSVPNRRAAKQLFAGPSATEGSGVAPQWGRHAVDSSTSCR
jgi:DNA-binding NarL/FixJ family response regulator